MKNKKIPHTRKLIINKSTVGKDLMTILREKMENKTEEDKLKDIPGRPKLYTERKDGVVPEGDPRTDKWDIMQQAADVVTREKINRQADFDKSGKRGNERIWGESGGPEGSD